jgi:hypothetical protein
VRVIEIFWKDFMKLKEAISYLTIIFISITISLVLFEIYARVNNSKYYSYGWQVDNVIDDKIKTCKSDSGTKKITGVFGDSFVEFYGERNQNLVVQLNQKASSDQHFCNFGVAGADIPVYISRLKRAIQENVKMDSAIFYLYEGNDFVDFIDSSSKPSNRYEDPTNRELTFAMRLVKSSYAMNIIYRQLLKPWFLHINYNDETVRQLFERSYYKEVMIEDAIARVKNTPKEHLDKFESDLLNKSWYEVALMSPNYFKRIHHPDGELLKKQKKIVFSDIDLIISLCKKNKIRCEFVLIPHDFFLFAESKKDWTEVFRFNAYGGYGPSEISEAILSNYKASYYPAGLFETKDYIKYDGHLTGTGTAKLADFTCKIISK